MSDSLSGTSGEVRDVLVISSLFPKPGVATGAIVHRQVLELSRSGIRARVICPLPRWSRPLSWRGILRGLTAKRRESIIDGIRVMYLPYWNMSHRISPAMDSASLRLSLRRAARRIRREFRFGLVHVHRLFPTAHAALAVASDFGVPLVATAHGSDVHTHPSRNSFVREATAAAIRRSRAVLGVSRALAEQIDRLGWPVDPADVGYNGVDVEIFHPIPNRSQLRQKLGLPETGVGLCTVARVVREKGFLELLDAFERLRSEGRDVWLAVVGDGPLRPELERRVAERNLASRVFFAGPRPNPQVAEWLSASDLFVLASYNEGLPNAILEAMACGLPVVATDVGGTSEATVDGETGLLVPRGDVDALVAALRRLVDAPALRATFAKAGLARVREKFELRGCVRHVRETYERALAPDFRILYVTSADVSLGNGPGVNEREFVIGLHAAIGDRAHFLIPRPEHPIADLPERACTFASPNGKHRPLQFLLHSLSQIRQARRLLASNHFDLVVFRLDGIPLGPFWMARSLGPYAIKTLGQGALKMFDERRHPFARLLGRINRRILRDLAMGAQIIDACSPAMVEYLSAELGVERERLVHIDNAVNTQRFWPRPRTAARKSIGLEGDGPIVGYVGSRPWERGGRCIIEAAPTLAKRHPDLRVLVVGGKAGEVERLRARAEELGVADRCLLAGYVAFDLIPDYVAALDVGVSVSDRADRFAAAELKVRQYVACGKPVVASPGSNEFLLNENLGSIVEADETERIEAELLRWLSLSDTEREAFSRRAVSFARSRLSLDRAIAARLELWHLARPLEHRGEPARRPVALRPVGS